MKRTLLLPLMLLLAGCPGIYGDSVYGYRRSADLETMPSVDCVRKSIRSVPGVASVDFQQSTGSRPLTWTGVQAADEVYNFSFNGLPGSHIGGDLQITRNYKSETKFSESVLSMGGPPPRENIDATRPVMEKIEGALAARCGLSTLPVQIRETCISMDCKSGGKAS
jgi:hypothetical protein